MERNKPLSFLGAAWEILRFFILFLLLALGQASGGNTMNNLLLMWFGASQLTLCAGFIMIGLYPERYGASAGLLALGKFLGLLPGAGVTAIQASAVFFVQMQDGFSLLSRMILPFFIVSLDLIFCSFLLSYSKTYHADVSREKNDRPFPPYDGNRAEEE